MIRAAVCALALLLTLDASALPRDQVEVRQFRKANPCPATGRVYGRCPGYQVDHVHALRCGGIDKPSNMQWLTIEAHKAKSREEARRCPKVRRT